MSKAYDYDLFVIGAGSAGVRAARLAAERGRRVAIAEEDRVGGTCVLRGCVPKKLFVHGSHYSEFFEDAVGFGWRAENLHFDWSTLVNNIAGETAWLSGVYIRNLEKAGVTILHTRAAIEDPHRIRLLRDNRSVTAEYVLIATGGRPRRDLPVPGIEHAITSDEFFTLKALPKRAVIVGGGFVAVEIACVFARFAVETIILHRGDQVLRGFDNEVRRELFAAMDRRGIAIMTGEELATIDKMDGGLMVTTRSGAMLAADQVLLAIGRHPNTMGLGLDEVGVKRDARGAVIVDAYSQASVPNIYAVGDVTDRMQFTPVAIREGTAFVQTVFGGRPTAVDYEDIPVAVFGTPEVGSVGLTEEAARLRYASLDIYRAYFRPLANRVAGRDERMLAKLVVDADTDRLVGCHFVGPSASELAQLMAIALKTGATKAEIDATTALHPTLAEEIVTMGEPTERIRRSEAEMPV